MVRRANSGETLVEARSDAAMQSVRYTWVLARKANRTFSQLIPSAVSLRIPESEQISTGSATDWRNREHVVLDLNSNF